MPSGENQATTTTSCENQATTTTSCENNDAMTTSTGSVTFEVVLEPARTTATSSLKSPRMTQSPVANKVSLEEIQSKLKLAEERRASVEAEKIGKAKTVEQKLAEAAERRASLNEEFKKQSEQEIAKKMEITKENRERLINERMEKMKEYEKHVDEVRKSKELHGGENGGDKVDAGGDGVNNGAAAQ